MTVRFALFVSMLAIGSLPAVHATAQASGSVPAAYPSGENTQLGRQIQELLRDPSVARAHWGIAVTTLTGDAVFGLDEGKLFRPASTAKLFTAAAALALLGPDHRFTTRVYGDLEPATGIVHGDLTLLGGGDPSFGTDDLPYHRERAKGEPTEGVPSDNSLAGLTDTLVAKGLKQITGQVIADDTLFEPPTAPEGWAAEDLLWGYGALPDALTIGDNELRITVRPGAMQALSPQATALPGSSARADQLYPYLALVNEVITLPPDSAGRTAVDAEAVPDTLRTVRLFGSIRAGGPPVEEHLALPEPALYAGNALRALLAERSVQLNAEAGTLHTPHPSQPVAFLATLRKPVCATLPGGEGPSCTPPCVGTGKSAAPLVEHLSQPLIEDVAFTLKTSANVHAELLLHHLGLLGSCTGATTLDGARVLRAWLLRTGLQEGDVTLYDGSGLSTKDLVTPRGEAKLLAYAAAQPWGTQWIAALPLGGFDGTLASRFPDPPLKGHVYAKTGTLGETRALAGYVDCVSGKRLIFSILVDNHEPGTPVDRITMDRIVAAIARLN